MAILTINFHANTTGNHYIGWQTYNEPDGADPTLFNVITLNVTTIGPQAVPITVNGNLYCAPDGISYNGYIIAACQDQTDGNGDGIPDLAIQWTVVLAEQTDPCQKTQLTCATEILSVTVDNVPGVCTADGTYDLIITPVVPGDEIAPAHITCDVTAGVLGNIVIVDAGLYKATPAVTADPLDFTCAVVPVFAVDLDKDCPSITLADYACSSHLDQSADSEYILHTGDTVEFCADVTALVGLPADFEVTDSGNCHCDECKHVTVTCPGATTGTGKVTYQTCWRPTSGIYTAILMVSRTLQWDESIDLGCILPDTLVIDIGTIDQPSATTIGSCT